MAQDFGASSPTTMCRYEITKNAAKNDTALITSADCTPTASSSGSRMCANAGSPTQPRPREARVIPNWQADR
ncbi:hypothetical protein D3C84_1177460 [compost metagenome]